MRRIVPLLLALVMCLSLCACGAESKDYKDIKLNVQAKASGEYTNYTFQGIELEKSSASITSIDKVNDDQYTVYGKMTFVDVYGDSHERNFSCPVIRSSSGVWMPYDFEYSN